MVYSINPDTSELTKHEARLNAIEKRQLEILRQDSLTKKIEGYEARLKNYETNQTYFQSALNSQTTIFSVIVAVFFALTTIITLSRIRHEIKLNKDYIDEKERVLKEDFKVHIDKIQEMEKSIEKQRRNVSIAAANTYSIAANIQENSDLGEAFVLCVRAIQCHVNGYEADSLKENVEVFRANILEATRVLNKIEVGVIQIEEQHKESIQKTLQNLIKIDDPTIIEPAANLHSKSITILKYKKATTA